MDGNRRTLERWATMAPEDDEARERVLAERRRAGEDSTWLPASRSDLERWAAPWLLLGPGTDGQPFVAPGVVVGAVWTRNLSPDEAGAVRLRFETMALSATTLTFGDSST